MAKYIAVVGMPGSGKEEFVKIAVSMGYSVVRMGDVVREEAKRLGLEMTDKSIGGLAQSEREKHGYGIWAVRAIPRLKERMIIDGALLRARENNFLKNNCVFMPSRISSLSFLHSISSMGRLNSLAVLLRKCVLPHPGGPYRSMQP